MRVTGADFIIASVLELVLTVAQLIATAEQDFFEVSFSGQRQNVCYLRELINLENVDGTKMGPHNSDSLIRIR